MASNDEDAPPAGQSECLLGRRLELLDRIDIINKAAYDHMIL